MNAPMNTPSTTHAHNHHLQPLNCRLANFLDQELLVPCLHVVALMLIPKPESSMEEGPHPWTCILSMG
jgi:hypothetical protein